MLVMGVPGAGKSRLAADLVARGYLRLNRDERGGSLRDLAAALDEALAEGAREVVLDNTYLTRASRSYVVEAATRHGISARCVWLDTPLAQAQINLVERLLDRFGKLLTPEELNAAARSEPGVLSPTRQMRSFRELEAPADDEGFAVVERVPFERAPAKDARGSGVLVAAAAVGRRGWEEALAGADPKAPHLVFDWRPDGTTAALAAAVTAVAERRLRHRRGGDLPAPGRRADLLVPRAASGAPARLRTSPRDRPHPLGRARHECRAPNARDRARRAARLVGPDRRLLDEGSARVTRASSVGASANACSASTG